MDITIISGGQTGVDRGALDAALEAGAQCGGWCPEGRMADDGPIPERYPLQVLPGSGYRKRTRQNVIDTDATVIIYFVEIAPKRGTEQTINECIKAGRPHHLIDGASEAAEHAAADLATFCKTYGVKRLNVAGPKALGVPHAHAYTQDLIGRLLQVLQKG